MEFALRLHRLQLLHTVVIAATIALAFVLCNIIVACAILVPTRVFHVFFFLLLPFTRRLPSSVFSHVMSLWRHNFRDVSVRLRIICGVVPKRIFLFCLLHTEATNSVKHISGEHTYIYICVYIWTI